jgi:hypothetical protein
MALSLSTKAVLTQDRERVLKIIIDLMPRVMVIATGSSSFVDAGAGG